MTIPHNALLAATDTATSASANLWYFLIAYIALWLLIFGYLFYLHGRVKSIETELENQSVDPLSTGDKVTPPDRDQDANTQDESSAS